MPVALTDLAIERMRPPKDARVELGDAVVRGLSLRVTPSGVKSWSVIYKVPGEGGVSRRGGALKGTQHRITLGPWPALRVTDARQRASEIVLKALEGTDPRRTTGPAESVAACGERMVEMAKKEISEKGWKNLDRNLRLHVVPKWGHRPLSSISRAEVNELLDGFVLEGRVGTSREVRKSLTRLFSWAAERGMVQADPLLGMRRRDPAPEEDGRALSLEEVRELWPQATAVGYPYGSILKLLLLTGLRLEELRTATWEMVDKKRRALVLTPAQHKTGYKTGQGIVAPFCDPAWEIMKSLPRFKGDFIFSNDGGETAISLSTKVRRARFKKNDWVWKDTRKSVETIMASIDVPDAIIDRVLNHQKDKVKRAYNRHDYVEQKRAALQRLWEAYNVE